MRGWALAVSHTEASASCPDRGTGLAQVRPNFCLDAAPSWPVNSLMLFIRRHVSRRGDSDTPLHRRLVGKAPYLAPRFNELSVPIAATSRPAR